MNKLLIILPILVIGIINCTTSIVYNFRVSEITKHPIFKNTHHRNHVLTILFEEYEKKRNGEVENFLGNLTSGIWSFNRNNYVRVFTAVANMREIVHKKTVYSGTGWDDVLIMAGHEWKLNTKSRITLSGLFGIPTHKIKTLKHLDFGINQFGFGGQLDGLHEITDHHAIYGGGRYVYFKPRHALNNMNKSYYLSSGNILDFLLGYRFHGDKNDFDLGYTIRTKLGAFVRPYIAGFKANANYVRSSFYAAYKRKFRIFDIPNRIILDITYSFDHKKNQFAKRIIGSWISWDINF